MSMGKLILHQENLDQLQELIISQLEALSQAKFDRPEVRKQIAKIIVSRFKKQLGIVN